MATHTYIAVHTHRDCDPDWCACYTHGAPCACREWEEVCTQVHASEEPRRCGAHQQDEEGWRTCAACDAAYAAWDAGTPTAGRGTGPAVRLGESLANVQADQANAVRERDERGEGFDW